MVGGKLKEPVHTINKEFLRLKIHTHFLFINLNIKPYEKNLHCDARAPVCEL